MRATPHAASKGFGAPAKKQQDNGAAKKDKGRGASRKKEHGHISGTSSQVSLINLINPKSHQSHQTNRIMCFVCQAHFFPLTFTSWYTLAHLGTACISWLQTVFSGPLCRMIVSEDLIISRP